MAMYFDELLQYEKEYSFPQSSKTHRYQICYGNCLFDVKINSEDIAESLRCLYGAMIVATKRTGNLNHITYCHFKEYGRYIITRNGKFAYSYDRLSDAIPRFDWMLMSDIVDHNRAEPVIHAGAVHKGDKTIILVGESGSGKSVLSLMMALEGWEFISDDIIFFQKGIHGVPRAFCVDEGLARDLIGKKNHFIKGIKRGKRYVYIDPFQINLKINRSKAVATHIVFLNMSSKENMLKQVSSGLALQHLIGNLFDTSNSFEKKLDTFIDELENIKEAELTWCDMSAAVNKLKEFVDSD